MIFLDDGKYYVKYEHVNRKILGGDVINLLLIICTSKFSGIDEDDNFATVIILSYLTHFHTPLMKTSL